MQMKRIVLSLMALGMLSLGTIGCADKASTKSKTETSGPGGTTTVEHDTTVKQTGDNPPAPAQK